jgi:tRNA (guanine37-N1)-methyltransferase
MSESSIDTASPVQRTPRLECDILTLFPGMVKPVLEQSILKKAQEKGLLSVNVYNLRDFTQDKHQTADDYPYGGGGGMVMKPEPIFGAMDEIRKTGQAVRVMLTSPQGRLFDQRMALELSQETRRLVIICGHYEGVDERVRMGLDLEEVSIGDFVLTGGELPGLVVLDAAVRLIPGVLNDPSCSDEESFSQPFLDHPQFTRPVEFRGMRVPEILLSGNHQAVARWRKQQALLNTLKKRPDIIFDEELSMEERQLLAEVRRELTESVVREQGS